MKKVFLFFLLSLISTIPNTAQSKSVRVFGDLLFSYNANPKVKPVVSQMERISQLNNTNSRQFKIQLIGGNYNRTINSYEALVNGIYEFNNVPLNTLMKFNLYIEDVDGSSNTYDWEVTFRYPGEEYFGYYYDYSAKIIFPYHRK